MNDNVFTMTPGGKGPQENVPPTIPELEYQLVYDESGEVVDTQVTGFLIFTANHVAVLSNKYGDVTVPVAVVPNERLISATLVAE
jgi:hypothetical protein